MPYTSYVPLVGLSIGETSFTFEKEKVTDSYIDFLLKAYGDKWGKVDVAFEYRFNDYDQWRTDAVIIGSQSVYIQQNTILGLTSSGQGTSTRFRWKYIDNNVSEGMSVQLRLRQLPRTSNYSHFANITVISEAYGESFFDFKNTTSKRCIGRDLYGRYICTGDATIYIFESLTDSTPLYNYVGLGTPTFVKQIRSGNYIVSAYDNNLVVELDSTLDNIVKSYAITSPVYFDYSEQNETLIAVSDSLTSIYEVTWSDMDYGTLIWQSGAIFTSPSCATYNRNNFDDIVITDDPNVYIVDKYNNTYVTLDSYSYSNGVGEEGTKAFWHPYRAYFYENNTICVVEQDGEILDFETLYTSSSSSIDSSSSSSSPGDSSTNSSSSSSPGGSDSSSSSSSSADGIGVMKIGSTFRVG